MGDRPPLGSGAGGDGPRPDASGSSSTLAGVHYDGKQLTPELLERQIRSYYAMRELIDEWKLDFSGIKAQPELTDHFATMDVTEAFLNDPYDWDGPKEPHVCATEADMDARPDDAAAQVARGHAGAVRRRAALRRRARGLGPVQLRPARHLVRGAQRRPRREPRGRSHLYPEGFYFPAGGASIHHLAAPGEFTFARLTRLDGEYRMQVLGGTIERFDDETNERLMRASTLRVAARLRASRRRRRTSSSRGSPRTTSMPCPATTSRRCGSLADTWAWTSCRFGAGA